MAKNKLQKFAEMDSLPNVFQCPMSEMNDEHPAVRMAGRWNSDFFHNDHPITLELGCGHGEYTVGMAQRYPHRNFIGIDIKGARMWHGAKQAFQNDLSNVAFLRINIEWINRFFAPDEVSELWITFPDPQMKKATKRLTSTFFLQRYRQLLTDNGIIRLKTDSPFLYTYTRAMLQTNSLPVLADTDDLYHSTLPAGQLADATMLQTHYEQLWLSRGLNIRYLCWQLPATAINLQEPNIEIEKDTYRSHGRNQ